MNLCISTLNLFKWTLWPIFLVSRCADFVCIAAVSTAEQVGCVANRTTASYIQYFAATHPTDYIISAPPELILPNSIVRVKTALWWKVAINIFPVKHPGKSNSFAIKIKTYSIVANPKPIRILITFQFFQVNNCL